VAVAIGLDDSTKARGVRGAPEYVDVVRDGVEVDLDPSRTHF